MSRRGWRLPGLILLPAVLCFPGCGARSPDPQGDNAILVQVGAGSYTRAELDRFFDSRLNEFRDSVKADVVKSALLDAFVEEKLLLRRAEQLKIEPNPQSLDSMREKLASGSGGKSSDLKRDADLGRSMEESLKIQGYLHDYVFKGLSVTQEECEAYYKGRLGDFVTNDVVHVREILVEDEGQAKKIQAALKAQRNRNFGELARLYSKAPTAADGGDLGTFQRGDLPEEFEKVIFPQAPGTVSKIVRTQYGYHMFFVEEKILAHQQRFYEVEEQIQEKLLLERQRAALDKEMASLASQIPIRVDREHLNFKYVGTRLPAGGGKSQ
jgi:parvulin-like peptidyl-prolyl isomerase